MSSRHLGWYLSVPSVVFTVFFCVFFASAFTRYRLTLCDRVFYTLSTEVFLYHSSFEVIAWYLGLLTFKHVLPLLKITNKRFLHAAATVNANVLQVSEGRHLDRKWKR